MKRSMLTILLFSFVGEIMRRFLIPIIILIFVFDANAQTNRTDSVSVFGLGISFEKTSFYATGIANYYITPVSFGNIYFPINLLSNFRIEPGIGLNKHVFKNDAGKGSYTIARFGLGVLYVINYPKTKITLGLRAGYISISDYYEDDSNSVFSRNDNSNDYYIGPVLGGEYFFSKHFSIGGEVQFYYISFGEFQVDENDSYKIYSTNSLILLRLYF